MRGALDGGSRSAVRMSAELVMELLGRGATMAEMLGELHDRLTADDIQACLAYASDFLIAERVYVTPT